MGHMGYCLLYSIDYRFLFLYILQTDYVKENRIHIRNLFASQQKEHLVNRSEAIVMNPSVTVRSTPSESGTSLFILHEGRKVSVKDNSMKEWKEIRLEDGKVGWVPASAIEVI